MVLLDVFHEISQIAHILALPSNVHDDSTQTSRDTTPAGTPRGTPRNSPAPDHTSSSDDEGDSSDLEPSPPHVHAQPQSGERQSRAPRRPHQNIPSSSSVRSGSTSRPRIQLPRAPPRPRSAPPTKHRSRFNPSGGSDYRGSPAPSIAPSSPKEMKGAAPRELAHDVLSQGQWYRVPEKTIRLDFWSKIGIDTSAPARPSGHGGTSMMRTNSMPSYSPRETLLTPDGSRTSFFSPSSATEDSFSPAEGDFSDTENAHGKRERYLGPLFGSGGSSDGHSSGHHDLSGLDRLGHINLASSPHGTPKRRPASLKMSAPSSPRFGHRALSPSSPPAISDYPNPKLSPEQALVMDDAHSSKRLRSTSPASPPSSPSLANAAPALLTGAGPASPSTILQHPSPLMHHNIAAQSIPRSSSPLRFSSTLVQAHAPLPKSSLSSPALSHAQPAPAPLEDSLMDADETTPKVEVRADLPGGPPPVGLTNPTPPKIDV